MANSKILRACKGVWRQNVYVPDPEGLGVALAKFLHVGVATVADCCSLFYLLQLAFACADFNDSLVFSKDRSKVLFNTGLKKAGDYVFMLMPRNKNGGPQPYIFQGKFCCEGDFDAREFPKIPGKRDLVVDPQNVVNLADYGEITIGSYHTVVEHADRVEQYICCGSYHESCEELRLCVEASVAYAKSNSRVLELNSYKGRLQVVIPFLDRYHRVCKDLAVVLEYDAENRQLVVPTILKTTHVKQDRSCKWSCMPHADWVSIYGAVA